jgi:hypothetical protein
MYFKSGGAQALGNNLCCAALLKAQFGMAMEIPPQGHKALQTLIDLLGPLQGCFTHAVVLQ